MITLHSLLRNTGRFSDEECSLMENEVQLKKLAKGEKFLNKNEVCSFLGILIQGNLYHYKLDDEGETHIIDLNLPGEWVLNAKSFAHQKPSEYIIEAFDDCEVYMLSIHQLHQLIERSPAFFQLGKVMEIANERLGFFDNNLSPEEKYTYVLEHKPGLLQHFPLKIIASYLKITPETLSRVRKKISNHS